MVGIGVLSVVANSRFSGGSLGYYRACHVAYIRRKGDARGFLVSLSWCSRGE